MRIIVRWKCGYGYEAWLNEDLKYRTILISSIQRYFSNTISTIQYLELLLVNQDRFTYILSNRLYRVLNIPYSDIITLTYKDLKKIDSLLSVVDYGKLSTILNKVHLSKINKYNIANLFKFVRDIDHLRSGNMDVTWGPGNHKIDLINIRKHFEKHENEIEYMLKDIGSSYESFENDQCNWYEKFAIFVFHNMKEVIVHSNGRCTYMSGFYGKVFLVGRYEGEVFGISTCYFVESGIKLGREKDMCFSVMTNMTKSRQIS